MKKLLILLVFFLPHKVYGLEFHGKFIQGHFIIGKTETGTKVLIDKKEVRVNNPKTKMNINITFSEVEALIFSIIK